MDKNLGYTMKFEGLSDEKMDVAETINYVYDSLIEKGYNPVNQIIGYLLSGDSSYITSYNNARAAIKSFERDEIFNSFISFIEIASEVTTL